jgi:hypothetical protein
MLGNEAITPSDLTYEMSPHIKYVPSNHWAWILCEHLEIATKSDEITLKEIRCTTRSTIKQKLHSLRSNLVNKSIYFQ